MGNMPSHKKVFRYKPFQDVIDVKPIGNPAQVDERPVRSDRDSQDCEQDQRTAHCDDRESDWGKERILNRLLVGYLTCRLAGSAEKHIQLDGASP